MSTYINESILTTQAIENEYQFHDKILKTCNHSSTTIALLETQQPTYHTTKHIQKTLSYTNSTKSNILHLQPQQQIHPQHPTTSTSKRQPSNQSNKSSLTYGQESHSTMHNFYVNDVKQPNYDHTYMQLWTNAIINTNTPTLTMPNGTISHLLLHMTMTTNTHLFFPIFPINFITFTKHIHLH